MNPYAIAIGGLLVGIAFGWIARAFMMRFECDCYNAKHKDCDAAKTACWDAYEHLDTYGVHQHDPDTRRVERQNALFEQLRPFSRSRGTSI